jgi:hypothetical protein
VSAIGAFGGLDRFQQFGRQQTPAMVLAQRPRVRGDRRDRQQHLDQRLPQRLGLARAAEIEERRRLLLVGQNHQLMIA